MPAHGEYVQGRGYYDLGLKGYVSSPAKVTPLSSAGQASPRRPDLGTPRTQRPPLAERVADSAAAVWQPRPDLEQLRRLRDSERSDERAMATRMLMGRARMELATYEAGLSAYLERGGELPEGVQRP